MKYVKRIWKNTIKFSLIIYLLYVTVGCSKNDTQEKVVELSPNEKIELSSTKQISSLVFLLTNNPIALNVVGTIDEENKTITATMPPNTNITGLLPEVQLSERATIDHSTAQNFTDPIEYTVTAEDGSTVVYTVTINVLLTQRQILQAILDANPQNTLDWNLNLTANLGDLEGIALNIEDEIIELNMGSKNISELPAAVGQLTSLTYLDLLNNQLTSLPPQIGQLTKLEDLRFARNQLTELPLEIGKLTNLTILITSFNQISTIPTQIGQLIKLEVLYLSNNQFSILPTEIGRLVNLRQLLLGVNQLSFLPLEITQLINLNTLGLSNNQLTIIPDEIGMLTNLKELNLARNQLTQIPAEIGFLTDLFFLDMTSNNLTTIPQSIDNLRLYHAIDFFVDMDIVIETTSQKDALISIYSANPDNTLNWGVDNYPEVTFDDNENPVVITVNNKNLTRIPDDIDQLISLTGINANNNNIENLPSSLGNISTLNVLTFAKNLLNAVPSNLGQLTDLALLSLTQNSITSIPQEVCELQTSNGGILTILTDPGEGCD